MKKLLLLSILFVGCTNDQIPQETCICELALYEDNAPVGCFWYAENVEIDCQSGLPLVTLPNSVFRKCLDE